MAQQTRVIYFDDITGAESDDVQTHTFALNGTEYEIDLTDESFAKLLEAFEPIMEHGRRVKKSRSSRGTSSKPGGDPVRVRKWAKDNGYEVNARGRVPGEIVAAYLAAQG
ncbi:histone-like nucleoid-structuring protein Lsr2 [Streptomyces atratus]|uniref:histone-like nucleoid-structuring protein Lsr2 n=1 Tax=Streptomyces atratus TaxID=1893 RepID=UPI0036698B14